MDYIRCLSSLATDAVAIPIKSVWIWGANGEGVPSDISAGEVRWRRSDAEVGVRTDDKPGSAARWSSRAMDRVRYDATVSKGGSGVRWSWKPLTGRAA